MTIFTFANNVSTTLAGPVSSSATTITLANTANLPASIPSGQVLAITLNDVATRQNYEVVYATARTGATLTVLRGQEGTAALSWLTGDYAFSPPTAGQQASFGQLTGTNAWSGPNSFSDPVAVAAAAVAAQAVNLGQFPANTSGTGHLQIPCSVSGVLVPFIFQWGQAITNSSGIATLTLDTPFPNFLFTAIANYVNNGTGATNAQASISNLSSRSNLIAIVATNGIPVNLASVNFMAIGY
ncbi:gp53-like domain-containing protein [Paraburkholderia caledonica]|uniref:Putative tail fiber protein gp53-like C-terminal domain-containing protein n=1 Tax=Paraburkholderia caledonica TaxID=134536 RepID=A0AB73IP03_9BURK|nr:hypothetical protein [Paraburkholderia caledonica]